MNIEHIYRKFLDSKAVSTDTRNIIKESMFFALKGDNFDANTFADDALQKGAKYVVIDNPQYDKKSEKYILVDNVLETLQQLAKHHRNVLDIPIIALTGSNGKTTTKELINSVLSQKYCTNATVGNFNNHIGVPLTLLTMDNNTEIGIVEMGANHFEEIAQLCEITQPNYGYITNFGKAHLEGFGNIEGVIKAKSELYDYLRNNNGTAFINPKDAIQLKQTEKQKKVILWNENLKLSENNPFLKIIINDTLIQSNLIGDYNFTNIAAAIGIGQFFNVGVTLIKKGIEAYIPKNKRSEIITKGNISILLDAYNANPTSMEAALNNFNRLDKDKSKIVILGDMFELGSAAIIEHQNIAKLVEKFDFDKIIFLGENFLKVTTAKALQYKNYESFKENFTLSEYTNAYILIKGSRGMALERIVTLFD